MQDILTVCSPLLAGATEACVALRFFHVSFGEALVVHGGGGRQLFKHEVTGHGTASAAKMRAPSCRLTIAPFRVYGLPLQATGCARSATRRTSPAAPSATDATPPSASSPLPLTLHLQPSGLPALPEEVGVTMCLLPARRRSCLDVQKEEALSLFGIVAGRRAR